jgi:hypothetical protein
MVSWQRKGLLLLVSALVASALAASTSGAVPQPSADAAAAPLSCSSATAAPSLEVATTVTKLSACWHNGRS